MKEKPLAAISPKPSEAALVQTRRVSTGRFTRAAGEVGQVQRDRAEGEQDSSLPGEKSDRVASRAGGDGEHQKDEDPELRREERPDGRRQRQPDGGDAQAVAPAEVQVIGHPPGREDQLGPRDRPIEDVGPQHPGQRPSLQVRALGGLDQPHAASRREQPIPQLDVLDRRPAVALRVKPADRLEGAAAHRSEPRPEGLRVLAPLLVDVVVQKILVLGGEVARGRRGVVRAEGRGDVVLVGEDGDELADRVGPDADIGIDEENQVPPGRGHSRVARASRSELARHRDDPRAAAPRNRRGVVGRGAVVHDDHFLRLDVRGGQGVQTGGQHSRRLVGGDHGRQALHASGWRS